MRSLSPDLFAVLLDASRTSLEELTITRTGGFREFVKPRPEYRNVTDATVYMPGLRNITLGISYPSRDESTWPCIDDAMVIMELASTSALQSLNIQFSSFVLAQLAEDLPGVSDHPSLRLFEQSIARFVARQTAVSLLPEHRRKNRDGFWTPVLSKVFPLLYGQGKLRGSGP